jgi:hypothetical protein
MTSPAADPSRAAVRRCRRRVTRSDRRGRMDPAPGIGREVVGTGTAVAGFGFPGAGDGAEVGDPGPAAILAPPPVGCCRHCRRARSSCTSPLWVKPRSNGGKAIEAEFKEHHYGTKTRVERTVPAARPAGEGVYAVLQRGRNLHLTYKLELPAPPGEVQQKLNIPADADALPSGCKRKRGPEEPVPLLQGQHSLGNRS